MASKLTTTFVLFTTACITSAIGTWLMQWASRRAFAPTFSRKYDIVPLMVTEDSVVLRSSRRTTAPGTFGLHILGGEEPAVVGEILYETKGEVSRRLIHRPTALSSGSRCLWSGITTSSPEHPYIDDVVTTSLGPAPAWIVNPGNARWAIHVHGHGSDRRQTLRGVATATALGMTSLVMSFRNDGEGPASPDSRSHLGESEWMDLEDALDFAASRGATQCIVFGWSLGATMAVNTLHRSRLAHMIKGLVLVSPVLSWLDVLRANARHQRLPGFMGAMVAHVAAIRGLNWLAGLDEPLRISASDNARFTNPIEVPALILHSRNDWSVPIQSSRHFAESHGHLVELIEFNCSGHTQEWNSEPVMWDLAVRRWYGKLVQPNTAREEAARTATVTLDGVE